MGVCGVEEEREKSSGVQEILSTPYTHLKIFFCTLLLEPHRGETQGVLSENQ